MISTALPVHRITSTPQVRFTALSRLLDYFCSFRCARHNHRVTVETVVNGRICLAACCDDLLDAIERGLKARALHPTQA